MMKIGVVCLLAAPLAAQAPALAPRAVPLAALVREAEAANPAILAAQRTWRAARQKPSQAAALPDPEFEFSTMNVGGPLPLTGLPDQMMGYAGLGVSETLPFPGKLRLRGEMARKAAAEASQAVALTRRQVRAAVASAYDRISGFQETLALLGRDHGLLRTLAKIAAERYAVGQGNQADVLKAQLQLTELLAEQTVQQRERNTAEARLKQLLNRPLDSPDIKAERLTQSPAPPPPARMATGLNENPALRARALETARRQLGVRLARRNFIPDLHVAYMYEATGPGFPYRTGLSVGLSLPLFLRRKQGAALTEASESLAAARDVYTEQRNQLAYQERQFFLQARADARLLHIYRGGLLPQSAATWRSALTAYEAGREDFETVITAFVAYQNLQERYWQTLADHETALARLREVVGAYRATPGAGAGPGAPAAANGALGVEK